MTDIADRVQETTTTTGTGTVTLAGAVTGYQSFSSAFTGGLIRSVEYLIVSGNNWEVGKGTYDGATTLTRDVCTSSSNAGTFITLSGTSNVFCTLSTSKILDLQTRGQTIACSIGFAMP